MKAAQYILSVLGIFVFAGPVFAETAITAEVDRETVAAGGLVTYKVVVTSSEKDIPQPRIPSFAGFAVVSQAQSTTASFRPQGVKTVLVHTYILLPTQAGVLTIPPASIAVKGVVYASKAVSVTVTGTFPAPGATAPRGRRQPQQDASPEQEPSIPDPGTPQYSL